MFEVEKEEVTKYANEFSNLLNLTKVGMPINAKCNFSNFLENSNKFFDRVKQYGVTEPDYFMTLYVNYKYFDGKKLIDKEKEIDFCKFLDEYRYKEKGIILPAELAELQLKVKAGLMINGSKKTFKEDIYKITIEVTQDEDDYDYDNVLKIKNRYYNKMYQGETLMLSKRFLWNFVSLIELKGYSPIVENELIK